jgi:predicted metal-binding protein
MTEEGCTQYSKYIELALKNGAIEAKVIDASTVKTAAWVRLKCQFGCGSYGTNLCCPPYTPTAEETQKAIDNYSFALLTCFSSTSEVRRGIPDIEREIFIDGFYKAIGFAAGRCRLCSECNFKTCIHAKSTRPSMEGVGIDVFETSRNNGFNIEVLKNRDALGNYFGLILIE